MLLFLSKVYSESERLNAFFNPEKYMLSDDFVDNNKDELLKYFCLKGIASPSQLSRELSLNFDSINKMLSVLKKQGLITKYTPDRWYPTPLFNTKIAELHKEGVWGFERIAGMSWWMISVSGVEYLQSKYKGSQVMILSRVVEELNLKVAN